MKTKSINTVVGKIIIVPVPEDANFFSVDNENSVLAFDPDNNAVIGSWQYIVIPKDYHYKLLGTVTAPDIVDFDCSDLLELPDDFKNAFNADPEFKSKVTQKSFLSLLAKNGVDFVNRLGREPNMLRDFGSTPQDWGRFNAALIEWEKAEKSIWSKAVILLQINSTIA